MLGMLRDFGAFLINYLFNVLFLDFLFPILFNYNQPLQEWHFTPLSNGEGEPHSGEGEGLFLFRLHIPCRVLIRRLIALCHYSDERHDEAEEARYEIYPPCQVDAVRIG